MLLRNYTQVRQQNLYLPIARAHTHACTHMQTCTHTHNIHTHTHTRAHTHTHTHTQIHPLHSTGCSTVEPVYNGRCKSSQPLNSTNRAKPLRLPLYCSHLSTKANYDWPTGGCLRQVSLYDSTPLSSPPPAPHHHCRRQCSYACPLQRCTHCHWWCDTR